jgi:hypothetical protein
MLQEGRDSGGGQHGHPVLLPLAVADEELAPLRIDVLHAERQCLQQPQSAPVQQRGGECGRPAQLGEHAPHFIAGEHDRQSMRALRVYDGVHRPQRLAEHLAVEELHGGQR